VSARRYSIRHRTAYDYEGDVVHAHQLLHLMPRTCDRQTVLRHAIEVSPTPASRGEEHDAFGNPVTRLEFDRPHRQLEVVAEFDVEVRGAAAAPGEGEAWDRVREALAYRQEDFDPERLDACRFRLRSPYVHLKSAFADYAAECFPKGTPLLDAARALNTKIHTDFRYAPGETTIATPLVEVLEKRSGVCQDYAHVMIACLRSLGLAARYVSGYLRTTPKEEKTSALVGADASHAWVSVFCPPLGWIDLDPTNGVAVGGDHVTVAWGRDFGDVSPLRGVLFGGGRHTVAVEVRTVPLPLA